MIFNLDYFRYHIDILINSCLYSSTGDETTWISLKRCVGEKCLGLETAWKWPTGEPYEINGCNESIFSSLSINTKLNVIEGTCFWGFFFI